MLESKRIDIALLSNVFGSDIIRAFSESHVSEIIVNSDGTLLTESAKFGKQVVGRSDVEDIRHAMELLADYRGLYLNCDNPELTLSLPPDEPFRGARLQGLIPPAVVAPCMTIRKHTHRCVRLDDYVNQGVMQAATADFLKKSVHNYRNILVSGQPKSGKTTLTAALLAELPHSSCVSNRVIFIEDVPELRIDGLEDAEYLLSSHIIDTTRLLRCAMRMRPDRIIVGEVTDGAALALLKAWNTGCPGGIGTLHANNCLAALQRLSDLACETGVPAPTQLIATTMDVIVQIQRASDFTAGRKVTEVAVMQGYDVTLGQFRLNYVEKQE